MKESGINPRLMNGSNDEVSFAHFLNAIVPSGISSDKFYLTGYETIPMAGEVERLLESVLTSVISLNGEVLIVESKGSNALYRSLCEKYQIQYQTISTIEGELDFVAFEALLHSSVRISHVLISADLLHYGEHTIHRIGSLVRNYRRSLMLDCSMESITLKQLFLYKVDFAINGPAEQFPLPHLIARRSKLVQAEGNGRNGVLDLYRFWQSFLQNRVASIEPMSA